MALPSAPLYRLPQPPESLSPEVRAWANELVGTTARMISDLQRQYQRMSEPHSLPHGQDFKPTVAGRIMSSTSGVMWSDGSGWVGIGPYSSVSPASGSISVSDEVVVCDTSSPCSVSLPAGVKGEWHVVKDGTGNASVNNVTVTSTSTFDGTSSLTISTDHGCVSVVHDGSEWKVVSRLG